MENTDLQTNNDDAVELSIEPQTLAPEQEVGALRKVHEFLSEFDRVPGSLSSQWAQMLDTVAVVANSLLAKLPRPEAQEDVKE